MKRLLEKLNRVYKNEILEKQYLVFKNTLGEFLYFWISEDVSEDATNSSYEKYKEAVEFYKENEGKEAYIVHNHPNALPSPSLMDYKNAELLSVWSSILGINIVDYMVFSKYGYYSFAEAEEWKPLKIRQNGTIGRMNLQLNTNEFEEIVRNKHIINQISSKYKELLLVNDKLYFSDCLPLEFIKKEAENEHTENVITIFFSNEEIDEDMLATVRTFLDPTATIEILANEEWDITF